MQTFPSIIQRFLDASGRISDAYYKYLTQFTIAPPSFMDVSPDGSPFAYEAKEPGYLYVDAATGITLTRGTDTISVTGDLIPVAVNDVVTITYGALPTIKFIPSYGYNTTSA